MASMHRSTRRAKWKVGAFVAVAMATLMAACGNSAPPVEGTATNPTTDGSLIACNAAHPQAGCPCTPDGATAQCGELAGTNGGYATCLEGTTTCLGGIWSPCSGLTTMFKSLGSLSIGGSEGAPVRHPEGLGMNSDAGDAGDAGQTPCVANPCDPSCGTFVDNSNGVDGGPGLAPTDAGGWTLSGEGGALLDASTQCFMTLTGTVYDPAALEPVFNAVVAVPYAGNPVGSGVPPPIATGVPITDTCGGAGFAALRAATTDVNGKFTLAGVPLQSTVSVVVQIGRWRRTVQINTSACACGQTVNISQPATNTCISVSGQTAGTIPTCAGLNNYAGSANCLTRLPRTQSGPVGANNIPHIAVATGACDAIECTLYRMGVSSSEYTDENGGGRINVFNDEGAVLASPNANHDLSWLLGFSCPYAWCPTGSNTTTNIQNPSFEGTLASWSQVGPVSDSNSTKHNGTYAALLGSTSSTKTGLSSLSQTFTAPPGATGLTFWVNTTCSNSKSAGTDYFQATLADNTSGTSSTAWGLASANKGCTNTGGWTSVPFTGVTAGDSYTLTVSNTDADTHTSYAYVDDVYWTPPLIANLTNNYDMVVLPCDCGDEYQSWNWDWDYDDLGRQNLVNYANVGGRVFTSHWGREWIERASESGGLFPSGPFPGVANWIYDQTGGSATADIYTGGTWGANFNAWMTAVGAATSSQFTVNPWREDTSSVTSLSRLFVSYDGNNGTTQGYPADFTFDTPLNGATQVGRVMYTDMHLANGNAYGTFPNNCPTQGTTLTSQEAAAEYLLFDLGNCVSGQPVPPNYPPISTTGSGTNATCSGGTVDDNKIEPGSCTSDADCEMDFHCAAGTCIWDGQSGYYDSTCVDASGNPGVDLTIGVPCSSNSGTSYEIPICNRGGGTLAAGSVITIENSGNGGSPSAPWSCAPPPTPNPPSVSAGSATCSYALPMALGPGQCIDIDTSQPAPNGGQCAVLEVGERYLYVNYDQSIKECGTGFSNGTGAGCMNNTSHTKTTGTGCPAVCGSPTIYKPATFTRDFQGVCPAGYRVVWTYFSWSGDTPSDSNLDFQAWTADTQAQLGVQYPMSATLENPSPDDTANGYVDGTMYGCQNCPLPMGGAPIAPTYVDVRLAAAGYPTSGNNPNPPPTTFASHSWLRVNMILNPSSNQLVAPTLLTWNQMYDCVPSE